MRPEAPFYAALIGIAVAPVTTATVTPSSLAFGLQPDSDASFPQILTVTNTGNVALAGGTFTFSGGAPEPYTRPAAAAGSPCRPTWAVGASCTVNVMFTPSTATTFNRTLTVAYAGATVTGSPVTLTGTGEAVDTGTLTFTSATGGTISTIFGVRTLTFRNGWGDSTLALLAP